MLSVLNNRTYRHLFTAQVIALVGTGLMTVALGLLAYELAGADAGAGDGDDEQIIVDLSRVPPQVKSLVFTVNAFTGQTFQQVANAYCRIVDASNNNEVARYNLSVQGNHTAQIMAKIYRHNGEWKMHAIGENGSGSTFNDLMPQILPHV